MVVKIKKYWLWISLVCLTIFLIIRNNSNINDLKVNGKQTKAFFYEVKSVGSKGTIRGFYRFEVEGSFYNGFYDDDNLKKYDSIDVIYLPNDPNKNQAKPFVDNYN